MKKIKLIVVGIVALIVLVLLIRLLFGGEDSDMVAVTTTPGIPVKPEKPHVRSEEPRATGTPRERDIRGRLRVKVKLPARRPDRGNDPPQEEEMTFDVLIPKGEELPPIVVPVDTIAGTLILPAYEDFRDPFFSMMFNVLLGASVEPAIGPSPYGGISVLTIAERFRIGGGIDRFALGPAAHWEFWREFNLGAKLNLLKFESDASTLTASLSYRF